MEKLIKIVSESEGVYLQVPATCPLAVWATAYFEAADGSLHEELDDVPKELLPMKVTGDLVINLPHDRYVFRNVPWACSKALSLMDQLATYDRQEDLLLILEEVEPENEFLSKGGFYHEKVL